MPSGYSALVDSQSTFTVPSFELESGRILTNVPVAYKTWGKLNAAKDNVMIICHAFTGSADVEDWWGPLMGPGKAFDPQRYFIFCGNVMGSPYGSASPLSINPDTGRPYGPEFPITTIRDDIRLHKIVLDALGVQSVAVVIGGSMGGMAVLEWPLCAPPGYIRNIVPIATSAQHSAWCISWGEAQRQSIYSDPLYLDGYYDPVEGQPKAGLAAARMAALLTYRSRDSFESRFGRKTQIKAETGASSSIPTPPRSPVIPSADDSLAAHNDGHRLSGVSSSSISSIPSSSSSLVTSAPRKIFTAQSYLRYQGDKFTSRFDANCYIHISRKLDTHDLARGRSSLVNPPFSSSSSQQEEEDPPLELVLAKLPPHALVISIQTDGLFTPSEQHLIASHAPAGRLVTIPSNDGHDGFLLEFEQINAHVLKYLEERLPELYSEEAAIASDVGESDVGFGVKKASMFGEAEGDITQW